MRRALLLALALAGCAAAPTAPEPPAEEMLLPCGPLAEPSRSAPTLPVFRLPPAELAQALAAAVGDNITGELPDEHDDPEFHLYSAERGTVHLWYPASGLHDARYYGRDPLTAADGASAASDFAIVLERLGIARELYDGVDAKPQHDGSIYAEVDQTIAGEVVHPDAWAPYQVSATFAQDHEYPGIDPLGRTEITIFPFHDTRNATLGAPDALEAAALAYLRCALGDVELAPWGGSLTFHEESVVDAESYVWNGLACSAWIYTDTTTLQVIDVHDDDGCLT